jgi:hypothetical protein
MESRSPVEPTELAQRQLDAYNSHDLEAFVACYHPEVEVRDFPSGELSFQGHAAMRQRYGPVFERGTIHAELVGRICQGVVAIDQEHVTGLADEPVDAVAMYEIEGELIRRVWFVRPRG